MKTKEKSEAIIDITDHVACILEMKRTKKGIESDEHYNMLHRALEMVLKLHVYQDDLAVQ